MRFVREAPFLAREIRRLIRANHIDLVYVNGPRLLPAAAMAADKLVFHSHNLLAKRYVNLLAGISLRKSGATAIASSLFVARLSGHIYLPNGFVLCTTVSGTMASDRALDPNPVRRPSE